MNRLLGDRLQTSLPRCRWCRWHIIRTPDELHPWRHLTGGKAACWRGLTKATPGG